MKFALFLAGVMLGAVSSLASAQVIYTPVTYQHRLDPAGSGPGVFYYGGTDPLVFVLARRPASDPGVRHGHHSVSTARPQAFSDAFPYQDLAPFGYTADDARNVAHRAVPTYFRKADLLRTSVPQPDGTRVVPPVAPAVSHLTPAFPVRSVAPALTRGTILILPMPKRATPTAVPTTVARAD